MEFTLINNADFLPRCIMDLWDGLCNYEIQPKEKNFEKGNVSHRHSKVYEQRVGI